MTRAGNSRSDPHPAASPAANNLELLRWHIDRYDRLRVSTATRAGVVLSAGALISAANAVVLSDTLGRQVPGAHAFVLIFCVVLALISASLVVLAVISASSVLVTTKDSRTLLAMHGDVPTSLLFNGTDTVAKIRTFADFSAAIEDQEKEEVLQAAKVELWIGIQQHRFRYRHLRSAVRRLRYASITLLIALVAMVIIGFI